MDEQQIHEMFRARLARFVELRKEHGEQGALEAMLDQETERERQQMGPMIAKGTLAEGFQKAIPIFEALGMKMRTVDLSTDSRDAVLEIHAVCPYAELAAEVGVERPCTPMCELDNRAVTTAFPDMTGRVLATIADGDCTCLFKYERPARG
jgi:predicted ArsR family transcriptional regulator